VDNKALLCSSVVNVVTKLCTSDGNTANFSVCHCVAYWLVYFRNVATFESSPIWYVQV